MQGRDLLTTLAGVLIANAALAAPPASTAPSTPTPSSAAPAPEASTTSATATAPAEPTPEGVDAQTGEPAPEASADTPPPVEEATPEPAPPPPEPVAAPPPAEPEPEQTLEPAPPSAAGPFARGTIHVGGTIGFSTTVGGSSSRSWFILGVGGGYFFLDGLEAHADTTFWIGDPFLATLTPGVRYVFHMVPVVKPYVGTFYRHYFVTGVLSDSDSLGARGGVNFMLGRNSYLAGGVIYEHFLDDALFENPDQVYPEITIAIAF